MDKELSCNVSVFVEENDKNKFYVARCEDLGLSDFGDTPEEALSHLKTAIILLLEEKPENKKLLEKDKPLMTTRLLINNI